VQVLRQNNNF